jgi:hypothetical protein
MTRVRGQSGWEVAVLKESYPSLVALKPDASNRGDILPEVAPLGTFGDIHKAQLFRECGTFQSGTLWTAIVLSLTKMG